MSKKVSKSASTKGMQPKKVEVVDETAEMRWCFDQFDLNGNGRIDAREIRQSFEELGFNLKNPAIYQLICEFDRPDVHKKGGMDFDSFVRAMETKFLDTRSKNGLKRVYELLCDDYEIGAITVDSLRKIAVELGENTSHEELRALIERGSKNGRHIEFEEFYVVMSRK